MAEMSGVPDCPDCDCDTFVPGCPCPVPARDLLLTYEYSLLIIDAHGSGDPSDFTGASFATGVIVSVPLVYHPAVFPHDAYWQTECFVPYSSDPDTFDALLTDHPGDPFYASVVAESKLIHRASFGCSAEAWSVEIERWLGTDEEESPVECPDPGDAVHEQGTNGPSLGPNLIWTLASEVCDTLLLSWQAMWDRPSEGEQPVLCGFVSDGPLPPITPSLEITVRGLDCDGADGEVKPGAAVEVFAEGDMVTPVATVTADGDGQCTVTVPATGSYVAVATVGDCQGQATVTAGLCGVSHVTVRVCCAQACFLVLDDEDDSPIEGATISGVGIDIETDGDGEACATLTTEQMLDATEVIVEGLCYRLFHALITKVDAEADPPAIYLERCVDVLVRCDDDGTDVQTVRLAKIPPRYVRVPELVSGCCPDAGCEEIGPEGRGLTPEDPDLVIEIQIRDAMGSVTSTLRIDAPGTLDLTAFDLTGEQSYETACVSPTTSPTHDPLGNPATYVSARARIDLCRAEMAPSRVRVRAWRDPGCGGGGSWDAAIDPEDWSFDFELPEEIRRVCLGEGIILIDEPIVGSDHTYSLSVLPPVP